MMGGCWGLEGQAAGTWLDRWGQQPRGAAPAVAR